MARLLARENEDCSECLEIADEREDGNACFNCFFVALDREDPGAMQEILDEEENIRRRHQDEMERACVALRIRKIEEKEGGNDAIDQSN